MSEPIYRVYGDNTAPIELPEGSVFDPASESLNPQSFADVLKLSHVRDFTARRFKAVGGYENAIDMNRECSNVRLEDGEVSGGKQSGIVIKGGSTGITLSGLIFTNVVGWCDYLIGDWSDQSNAKTTGVSIINNTRKDGKPVRVVVGRADWPTIVGGNVKICYALSYLQKAYWWLKFAGRKLHIV